MKKPAAIVFVVGALASAAYLSFRRDVDEKPEGHACSTSVPMHGDDGLTHEVAAGETLADAMAREETFGDTIRWETVRSYLNETTGTVPMLHPHELTSSTRRWEMGSQEGEEGHPGDAEGHCYNDGLPADKVPPEGKTACACYQATKCDPKSSESHSCKRHCRKDKCDCCAI